MTSALELQLILKTEFNMLGKFKTSTEILFKIY